MISTDQRVILVFLSVVLVFLISIHNLIKYPSFGVRIAKFIQVFALIFPFLDLKIPPADWNFKCFEASIFVFTLINLTSVLRLIKELLEKWVMSFLVLMVILALVSEFLETSLLAVFRLALVVLLIVYFKKASENGLNIIKKVLVPIVIWAVVFFLIQTFYSMEFTFYQSMNATTVRDSRYTSFAQDPQKFAQIAFMIAIIFIGDLYSQKKQSSPKYWLIIISCLFMGLSTGSRSPLFGLATVVFWLVLSKMSIKSVMFLLFITILTSLYMETLMNLQTFQRMNEVDSAYDSRLDFFWVKGWMIFMDNFLVGVGPGNFLDYVTVHHKSFTYGPGGAIVDQPESGVLLWLCENGIIGFLFYVSIIYRILTHSTKENNSKPYKYAIFVWMVGFITVFSLSDVKILVLLALCIGMIFTVKPKTQVLY